MNDELIDGSNTNTLMGVENTGNTAIAAENVDDAATDTESTDNDATNAENTDNAAKPDVNAMSNDNKDNAAVSDNNTDDTITGNGNTENTTTGKTSMVDVPSPLHYGTKTKDPSKVKASKKHTPIMVEPSEPSIGDPPPDEITMATASGHAFDPTCIYMNS